MLSTVLLLASMTKVTTKNVIFHLYPVTYVYYQKTNFKSDVQIEDLSISHSHFSRPVPILQTILYLFILISFVLFLFACFCLSGLLCSLHFTEVDLKQWQTTQLSVMHSNEIEGILSKVILISDTLNISLMLFYLSRPIQNCMSWVMSLCNFWSKNIFKFRPWTA